MYVQDVIHKCTSILMTPNLSRKPFQYAQKEIISSMHWWAWVEPLLQLAPANTCQIDRKMLKTLQIPLTFSHT